MRNDMYDDRKLIHKDLKKYVSRLSVYGLANDTPSHAAFSNRFSKAMYGFWSGRHSVMRQEYVRRSDGTVLRICIISPKKENEIRKTGMLWLHGGGYNVGFPEEEVSYPDAFCSDGSAVVIMPDYRKSTEAPYPAALEDAYLTLQWMLVNAERLQIRLDQIFVGGESAGGGLAAALSLYARDQKEINIAFQMILYPMIDDRPTVSSSHNTMPVWNTKHNEVAWNMYKGNLQEVPSYCAPARETDYTHLPPAFTFVGELDPFYAETVRYFEELYQADVPVMIRTFPGCFHAFDIMCPEAPIAKKARNLALKAFRFAQNHYIQEQ